MRMKDMLGALQTENKKPQEKQTLLTVWGEQVLSAREDSAYCPFPEYPRPQMARHQYEILNGWWDYRFGEADQWDGKILVPFSPESILSGVERQLQPDETLWYRRTFYCEPLHERRLLLHFGAVDQTCRIYLNGRSVAGHTGGYLPIDLDITDYVHEGTNELTVCCRDISDTGYHGIGKQKLKNGGMFYTAQSGIWQTVWMEYVPAVFIRELRIETDYDRKSFAISALLNTDALPDLHQLSITSDEKKPSKIQIKAYPGKAVFLLQYDTVRSWTPEDPFLYHFHLTIGEDAVETYAAMRCFSIEEQNGNTVFCLNHQPLFLNGVLDQGYWPEGLYTAPTDEALKQDILNMKSLGFNLLRKHCKIEPLRWYHFCAENGMIVWQDMINGGEGFDAMRLCYLPTIFTCLQRQKGWSLQTCGRLNREGRMEWIRDTRQTVRHLYNCPSISTWVLFNEGWGQFGADHAAAMVRNMDQSRTIDACSGWFDFGAGDFISEHNYFRRLRVPRDKSNRAALISEYGGITLGLEGHTMYDKAYGYGKMKDARMFSRRFRELSSEIDELKNRGLSGAVYTQVSDIEEEINGLYTYDRKICKLLF